MTRATSVEVISAYRATSVIDTPMRKLEVLEAQSGYLILRATEYRGGKVEATMIHVSHEEAHTLAKVLLGLEEKEVDFLLRKAKRNA